MYESRITEPDNAQPATECREGVRYVAVMRVATLHTECGEELCLVRNISAGGLNARIWSDLAVGIELTAKFKSGHRVSGKVIWRQNEHIGVQFDKPENVSQILSGDEDPISGSYPRAPRVHLEIPAHVRIGAHYRRVMLRDISQCGAKVRRVLAESWEEGEPPVTLTLVGLPPIKGSLGWSGGEIAGITFNSSIPLDTLARWIATRRG